MKLIIGGDFVPTDLNKDIFSKGDIVSLLGEDLKNILDKADIKIFNLEVPLSDKETPIKKCGPNLLASKSTIAGIKRINPTLLSLANNHILDHGEEGLKSTLKILNENEIAYLGVGKNLEEASKPYIISKNNMKIGIYSCAQHEFGIASNKLCGANPFDPLESLDHINKLKEECDYVIVLYHGGKEHYRYPSPYLQKICRKMIEKGADLVVCQHSHCIGCLEQYKKANIIYGQGNFLFNKLDNEFWNNGLIVQVDFKKGNELSLIPIIKYKSGIRLANEKESKSILHEFYLRSEEIKIDGFVDEKFEAFIKTQEKLYLATLAGLNRITRKINNILNGRLIRIRYNNRNILNVVNYIESEDHREILLSILKQNGRG